MKRPILPLLLALAAPASSAAAQELVTPFPLRRTAADGRPGQPLALDGAALVALTESRASRVRLADVPRPGVGSLALELERVPVDFSGTQVMVDGVERPAALASSDVTLWAGRVVGEPDSEAFFGFSSSGSRGWYRSGEGFVHLLAEAGEGAAAGTPAQRLVTQRELDDAGESFEARCAGALAADASGLPATGAPPVAGGGSAQLGSTETLVCRVAWETDYQLFQQFNTFNGMRNYVQMLLGAVAYRFREQIDVELLPVYLGFHTDVVDGWNSQDVPGASTGDLLNEFRIRWQNNMPAGANLAHFVSGAGLGGGVAYLNVLCSGTFGFAVSANITHFGRLPGSPAMQGPMTWDFYVIAHEAGHNFASPHTFDYAPQIDDCPNTCTNMGTIMSYCHLCSGGNNNITTFFHPRVVDVMRQAAENSCFPTYCGARNFCRNRENSTSTEGAIMGWSGTTSIASNDLVLTVSDAAVGTSGLFFYGETEIRVPFGEGFRCVGAGDAGIFRLHPITTADAFGAASRPFDLTTPPASAGPGAVTPGSTWNFQYWFRDPMGGPSGFNLSDGLAVKFCP